MIAVVFHEKSNLEKKLWFPENSWFFKIHNFLQNAPKVVTSRQKFPGIWGTLSPENARIYGFPGILEAKLRFFPGNFCQNFEFSWKPGVNLFTNSQEFWSTEPRKNAGIYGFPRILTPKFRFFPGNFWQNLEFSRNFGATRHEIPGNFGRKNPVKCRNIRVSRLFGGKNHYFPGNFGRPVVTSRKNVVVPQACTFKNIRVSRSPQAHILTPKKGPQKFICT